MTDDWRIRVELPEEQHAETLLGRLGLDLGSDEAKLLAAELEGRRLAVSRDGNELFVYASSPAEAEQALGIVEAELVDEGIEARTSAVEHWHDACTERPSPAEKLSGKACHRARSRSSGASAAPRSAIIPGATLARGSTASALSS